NRFLIEPRIESARDPNIAWYPVLANRRVEHNSALNSRGKRLRRVLGVTRPHQSRRGDIATHAVHTIRILHPDEDSTARPGRGENDDAEVPVGGEAGLLGWAGSFS